MSFSVQPLANQLQAVPVSYCNGVQVAASPWDISVFFILSLPPVASETGSGTSRPADQRVVQGVVMSPQHAKAFSTILQANVAKWESANGEIKLPADISSLVDDVLSASLEPSPEPSPPETRES